MNCERIAMVVLLRKWHSVFALGLVSYHFFSKSSAEKNVFSVKCVCTSFFYKTGKVCTLSLNLMQNEVFWCKMRSLSFCVKALVVITFCLNLVPKQRF